MNYFDKALNATLEGIERNVVDQVREAASALEEYPGQDAPEGSIAPAGTFCGMQDQACYWCPNTS